MVGCLPYPHISEAITHTAKPRRLDAPVRYSDDVENTQHIFAGLNFFDKIWSTFLLSHIYVISGCICIFNGCICIFNGSICIFNKFICISNRCICISNGCICIWSNEALSKWGGLCLFLSQVFSQLNSCRRGWAKHFFLDCISIQ